jgi:nitrogen fixation/metabolism regulation signal transduction histidine kinase
MTRVHTDRIAKPPRILSAFGHAFFFLVMIVAIILSLAIAIQFSEETLIYRDSLFVLISFDFALVCLFIYFSLKVVKLQEQLKSNVERSKLADEFAVTPSLNAENPASSETLSS